MSERFAQLNITSEYQQNSTHVKRTEIGKIPQEWKVVKTGDVCTSIVPGRNKPKVFDGDIPWITIPDIDSLMLSVSKTGLAVSREELKRAKGKTIPPNTVVMTCVGTFGIAAVTTRELVINQQLHGFVCNEDVLPLYLCWVLRSKEAQMISLAGKTTIPYLNREKCESIRFALPPLHEQKKIAAILSSVDEAIASTQAVINQTRKVKQGLLQQLLTRGIGHIKFKKSAIGKIPEFWKVKRIDELGKVQAGRQRSPHFTEGKIRPYLRVANVFDGYIDTNDVLEMAFTEDEYKRYCLQDGDILLNEGQSLYLVGRSAIYRGVPKNCCFQNTLIRFRAYKNINIEFAQTLFQFLQYSGRFSAIALQTTSIAHLGVSRFASLEVMLPPYEEQCEIAEIFSVQQKALNTEREKLFQLQIFKRGLMQDLLTGKVRVGCTP